MELSDLVPVAGRPAYEALLQALEDADPVPCATAPVPDEWWSITPQTLEVVVAACDRCPVRVECLAYAVEAGEKFGVWGGRTPAERGHHAPKRRTGVA